MEHQKHFIIIGNVNAITYKEIFPLLKSNKIWLGYGFKGAAAHFVSPYDDLATAGDHREGMIRVSGVNWFTNLELNKRHELLDLVCRYSPEEYPRYDNYDAINVDKTSDIPCNYAGAMGVPITFLDKYNPEQFEIIWQASGNTRASAPAEILKELKYTINREDRGGCAIVKGKRLFTRVFIRNKHPQQL